MEIVFATKSVRHLCESQTQAVRSCGAKVADVLSRRLSDIDAASDVKELMMLLSNAISTEQHLLRIVLADGYFLFLKPAPANTVTDPPVWAQVRRVMILRINQPQ